jgi:CubicO group peptidase (beta-lactamase class C family)
MRAILLLAWLLPSVAVAQNGSFPDSIARRIDSVFTRFDRTASPGCAIGVYREGRVVYSRGYGMANLEHAIAITPRTVFDIGSTSKQFTATAIVLLAQDGRLTLDDDVRKHIPELPQYAKPITIRHLLNHTSGLRDYLTLMSLRGVNFDGVTTDRDAFELVVRQKALNFDPGSEYLYSNSGFFLLSTIVRRASGKSLSEFASERIFAPLGMRDTHFHDDHTRIVPMRATGYVPAPAGGFRIAMSGFEQTGDGAVMTTVEDLLQWDNNFYTPSVGGEALLRDLHTTGVLTGGRALNYALGLMVDQYRGLRRVRHGGSWAGYRADLVRFPEAKTTVTCLCNLGTANPSALADRVADILLADRLGPATAAGPPAGAPAPPQDATPVPYKVTAAELDRYTGTYYAPELDASFVVTPDSGGVRITMQDGDSQQLPATARDTFGLRGLTVVFSQDRKGRPTTMTINAGRVRGIQAERR